MKMKKILVAFIFLIALCVDAFSFASVLDAAIMNVEEITSFFIVLSFLSVFLLVPVIIAHSLARFLVHDMKRNEKVKSAIVFIMAIFTGLFAVVLWIIKRILDLYSLCLTDGKIGLIDALITGMPVLLFFICIAAVCILMFDIKIIRKKSKKNKRKRTKRVSRLKKSTGSSSADDELTKEKGETEWEK